MNKKVLYYLVTGAVILFAFLSETGFTAFDFGFSKGNLVSKDSSGFISKALAEAGSKEKYN